MGSVSPRSSTRLAGRCCKASCSRKHAMSSPPCMARIRAVAARWSWRAMASAKGNRNIPLIRCRSWSRSCARRSPRSSCRSPRKAAPQHLQSHLPKRRSHKATPKPKGQTMKSEMIRVEPYSTWLESWKAPTSAVSRANGFVFVSGMPPYDPETGQVIENATIAKQTELVLEQMKKCLEVAGSDLDHVVKVIVYSARADKFAEINAVYVKFFPQNPPPRMFCTVAGWPGIFDI